MSANIRFQAVAGTSLQVGGASSFIECLERVFHRPFPMQLSGEDASKLEAIRDAEQSGERVALDTLIDAIFRCGTIRVWAEY